MLLTKCNELMGMLGTYADLQRKKSDAEQLSSVREELKSCRAKLEQWSSAALVFTQNGLLARVAAPAIKRLPERLTAIRERFDADPLSINAGRDFSLFKRTADESAEALQTAAEEAWQIHLQKARPRPDRRELDRYRNVQHFGRIVVRIEELSVQANAVEMPRSAEEFEAAMRLFEALRDELAKLPKPTDDPEVKRFLDAVNSRAGAGLGLLTAGVLSWLKANQMERDFVIRSA